MSKYPYTYSADNIRSMIETPISRADAARIKSEIARILEMSEEELASKIADDYCKREGIF